MMLTQPRHLYGFTYVLRQHPYLGWYGQTYSPVTPFTRALKPVRRVYKTTRRRPVKRTEPPIKRSKRYLKRTKLFY